MPQVLTAMCSPMTILLAFLAVLFVYAYGQAWRDFLAIELGQDIEHDKRLEERLWVAGIWWLICAALGVGAFNVKWYDALLWIPMGWAWWTAWFRLLLNKMRGKDWRYVSFSNNYDSFFLRLVDCPIDNRMSEFRTCTNRAGLLAYAFELLIFAVSVLGSAVW